jgi:Na+-driven multidrug efflux pump
MNAKLYLTIAAVLGIIYGIGFLIIPANLLVLFGTPNPDPRIILTAQYFGAALLGRPCGLVRQGLQRCRHRAWRLDRQRDR